MSLATLLLVAVGVSADAFAVSVGKGLAMRRFRPAAALRIAGAFGLFQGLMPLVGYLVGSTVADVVDAFDHWLVFGVLALVGGRMVHAAVAPADGADPSADLDADPGPDGGHVGWRELLGLSVATSIDALAVGVGLAFLDVDVLLAAGLIAVTTGALSFAGVAVGHRAGSRWRRPAELVGGLVLVGIGTRVLLDHLGVW